MPRHEDGDIGLTPASVLARAEVWLQVREALCTLQLAYRMQPTPSEALQPLPQLEVDSKPLCEAGDAAGMVQQLFEQHARGDTLSLAGLPEEAVFDFGKQRESRRQAHIKQFLKK